MITPTLIYWITRLDTINTISRVVSIILFILLVALPITFSIEDYSDKYAKRILLGITVLLIIFGSIGLFVPTAKEVVLMYTVPKIANNEEIKNVPHYLIEKYLTPDKK